MKVQFDPTCDPSQSPLIVNALEEASEKLKVKCQTVLDLVGAVLVSIKQFNKHIEKAEYRDDLRLRESLWEHAAAGPETESDYFHTGQFYPNHPWFGFRHLRWTRTKTKIPFVLRYGTQRSLIDYKNAQRLGAFMLCINVERC